MQKLSEELDILEGVVSDDIATADLTSDYYSMANARRVGAKLFTDTIAQTKIATIQLLQAKDDQGTDSKALTSVVTVTAPTGGAKLQAYVEAMAEDMDRANGYTHVAVVVGSDNATAVIASAVIILGEKGYL